MVIAASVITTFTTPYWIKMATPVYKFLDKRLSPQAKSRLDGYSLLGRHSGDKNWGSIITYSLSRVIIFSVLSIAVLLFLFDYLLPFINGLEFVHVLPQGLYNFLCAVSSLLVLSPFLFGIMHNNQKTRQLYSDMAAKSKGNVIVITVWTLVRMAIAAFFVASVLIKFFKYTKWLLALITLLVIIFMMFSRLTFRRFSFLENSFMENLNAKDNDPVVEN